MRVELVVKYKAVKYNRCDTQYQSTVEVPHDHWLTERVKVEAFQGYSRAYNLAEYFRTRGAKSWKSGEQVTGLWKSSIPGAFYGDRRTKEGKTFIVFYRSENHEELRVCVFPTGFYPTSEAQRNQLIQENL
jgi:hypothetical protein